MIERASWWPVARVEDLGPQPVPIQLLSQRLVLWRSGAGAVSVFTDRCPHRGAQLSLGRVKDDNLQCPYHGWRFSSDGQCVAMPAQPGFKPPASGAACTHEVQEAHGLWWVRIENEAKSSTARPLVSVGDLPAADNAAQLHAPIPKIDRVGLPKRHLIYGPFDVATSAPRAVENFLDTAHFAFVHEGWLGGAEHTEVPPYEVTHTPDGRPVIERYRAWQPRASASAQVGAWVEYRYEVLSPFAALLTKQSDVGASPQDSYTIWACPQTPTSCRLWFAQYTTDEATSAEVLRDFQMAIFAQDKPVLESQDPKTLPLSGGEAMSAADRLSAAYRRYLKACGITFGVS